MSAPGSEGQEPPAKRQRQVPAGPAAAAAAGPAAGPAGAAPYELDSPVHLLRVRGLSARHNAGCLGARLGRLVSGPLRLALVSNFMVDMGWLMSACPDLARAQTLVVVHGEGGDMEPLLSMQAAAAGAPHAVLHRPPLPIAYGTHHSKAFLLTYPAGLRLIVLTANAIYADCNDKAQGLWVQDFPPKRDASGGASGSGGGAAASSPFERDLAAYVRALGLPAATAAAVLGAIAGHDFSCARGALVGSVPGYHRGPQLRCWGHMRLRALLERVSLPPGFNGASTAAAGAAPAAAGGAAAGPAAAGGGGGGSAAAAEGAAATAAAEEGLVVQCSSMGSFDQAWLIDQMGAALAAHRGPPAAAAAAAGGQRQLQAGGLPGPPRPSGPPGCGPLPLAVVWPTVEEVRNSIEGWWAGSSIPGPAKNVGKPFMRRYYAVWGGEAVGRQRAMPHIKSYVRYRGQHLAWFLVTSHNLSKAAWGELQKGGTQLMIRSYELGVLVTPELEAAYRASPQYCFCCTDAAAAGAGRAAGGSQEAAPRPPRPVRFVTLSGAVAAGAAAGAAQAPRRGGDPRDASGAAAAGTDAGTGTGAAGAEELTVAIPVPYSLPPVPYKYGEGDQPWTVDEPRSGVDALGQAWGTGHSHYGHVEPPGE